MKPLNPTELQEFKAWLAFSKDFLRAYSPEQIACVARAVGFSEAVIITQLNIEE